MPWPTLPIEDLPAWAHLNDVTFHSVKVTNTEGKGYGVISTRDIEATEGTPDVPSLLTVPHDLVLNAAAVDEFAKEDRNFRHLLDAIGHRGTRADVLLFLLVQTALVSRHGHPPVGVSNPWRIYLQFLPKSVPVPTLWNEDERLLLRGTSLEAAVDAKITALDAEFGLIQEKSSDIVSWNEILWHDGSVSFTDYIRLDALYRSRCVELPRSGESMVPCLDMTNHAVTPSAYYEESRNNEVILLPRPGLSISKGDEVTISYGDDKSAAEMLFSYGFIDPQSATDSLVLPLTPFPDDPLAKAKLVAFGQAPQIRVARDENGAIWWGSQFAYLMCVNEEDGLEFRVLQDTDGGQQLRVFWQQEDVTDRTSRFEEMVWTHPFSAVFRLRVVTVVQETIQTQLERLRSTTPPDSPSSLQHEDCFRMAMLLRQIETDILEGAIKTLEEERTLLMAKENVVAYLAGLTEQPDSDLAGEEASNEADDFS
ncbi:SET domain-containing protein [Parathielavia appendiculata]|uniref:SET domain-containing protein n=1 Tax=Parathielavia appendiculata TaxID=2587402 RepID=A0AAN6TYD8_9PEZI|nr:SET domain-containing protein [Parathielavia appendiculata]